MNWAATTKGCDVSKKQGLRLVILDDHELIVDGIQARLRGDLPGAIFVYSGPSLADAITAVHAEPCDCAVLDLDLGDGTPATEIVSAFTRLDIPVVVVSAMARPEVLQAALAAGASAFMTKRSNMDELASAIRVAVNGGTWTPPDLAAAMLHTAPSVTLSEQEKRALILYASGLTLDMVARRMNITPHTVKYYLDRVREKYSAVGVAARTKVELHNVARSEGLLP